MKQFNNAILLLAACLSAFMAAPAGAASICSELSARLAGSPIEIGNSAESRRYAAAIAKQKITIRQTLAERRRQGCGAGSIDMIGDQPDPCGKFDEALERMKANLETLTQARQALFVSAPDDAERNLLKARFNAMGCSEPQAVVTQVSVEAAMPESETVRQLQAYTTDRFVDLGGADNSGAMKTMCVRSCDGGFFPISSHASTTSFARDAQVCSMMCPGVETELYYMPLTSDDTAAMRSALTGQRYDESPKAFAYRTERKEGARKACGCNIALYTKEMMRREAAIAGRMSLPADAVDSRTTATAMTFIRSSLRPTLGADKASPMVASAKVDRPWDPDRKIRKVGPDFMPTETIDFTKGK